MNIERQEPAAQGNEGSDRQQSPQGGNLRIPKREGILNTPNHPFQYLETPAVIQRPAGPSIQRRTNEASQPKHNSSGRHSLHEMPRPSEALDRKPGASASAATQLEVISPHAPTWK